ncbi:MAG TPA: nucleotidyltransferase family protein [Pyrinomonadaceae bacterium]|nr:nucleotidyltransferase family protein [Pyrinomonadaceae bacterium]
MISRVNPRLSWGQRERALLSVKRSIHLLSVRMTNEDGATSTVGLLLLAAGASRRLGAPKQLLAYKGESLLRRAARTALASLCRPVIVVLGAHRERVESEVADLPLEIVFNEEWAMGMGTSIRAGMEYLTARADTHAVVVMLCDQPRVEARIINELVAAYRATNAPLVTAKYDGTHGVPALFDQRLYPALLALTGSQGAKSLILAHSAHLSEVPTPEAALDVDTLADYERLVT